MTGQTDTTTSKVAAHYSKEDLKEKIEKALKQAELDSKTLSVDNLAPVDEFHFRGKEAIKEMIKKLDLEPTDIVLDIGSGLGGPARHIAKKCNCEVIGVDITAEFIQVAVWLNEKIELDNPPEFIQGDATDLPFDDDHFDYVITEHVNMNIEDKKTFIREMCRVIKPGGKLYFYEILAGPNQPAVFPVPWSETGETSFLSSSDEIKDLFKETGLEILSWEDTTDKAEAWYKELVAKNKKNGPPPLGIHLILGEKSPEMFRNLGKNLREDRIKVIQAVLQK